MQVVRDLNEKLFHSATVSSLQSIYGLPATSRQACTSTTASDGMEQQSMGRWCWSDFLDKKLNDEYRIPNIECWKAVSTGSGLWTGDLRSSDTDSYR